MWFKYDLLLIHIIFILRLAQYLWDIMNTMGQFLLLQMILSFPDGIAHWSVSNNSNTRLSQKWGCYILSNGWWCFAIHRIRAFDFWYMNVFPKGQNYYPFLWSHRGGGNTCIDVY